MSIIQLLTLLLKEYIPGKNLLITPASVLRDPYKFIGNQDERIDSAPAVTRVQADTVGSQHIADPLGQGPASKYLMYVKS